MSRLKRKEAILLGSPLPLPYKVESSRQPHQAQPEHTTHTLKVANDDTSEDKNSIDQSLKRILVGRLRKKTRSPLDIPDHNPYQYYHSQNEGQSSQHHNEDQEYEYIDRKYGGSRSGSGSSNINGISTHSLNFNNLKTAELLSKFHRLRSKLDLIESSFGSGDRMVLSNIENQIDTLNQEIDLLSQQLVTADAEVEAEAQEAPALGGVSVFDELERIRSEVHRTSLLQGQLAVPRRLPLLLRGQLVGSLRSLRAPSFPVSWTIALLLLVLFFTSSYFASNLAYDYCYYYC